MNPHGPVLAAMIAVAPFGAARDAIGGEVLEAAARAIGPGVVTHTRLAPGQTPVLVTFLGRPGDVLWSSGEGAQAGWRGDVRYLGDEQGPSRFEATQFSANGEPSPRIGFLAKTPGRVILPFKDADVFLIVEAVEPDGLKYHLEAVLRNEQIVDE
ncbi:hypothetical protein [Caulobacter sp. DWR2-3-1b2]|uniref:hypothetical protein n=1 Tax=unclassified Caulobacter TaxID=2648921 RepID=UPI003CF4D71E